MISKSNSRYFFLHLYFQTELCFDSGWVVGESVGVDCNDNYDESDGGLE